MANVSNGGEKDERYHEHKLPCIRCSWLPAYIKQSNQELCHADEKVKKKQRRSDLKAKGGKSVLVVQKKKKKTIEMPTVNDWIGRFKSGIEFPA